MARATQLTLICLFLYKCPVYSDDFVRVVRLTENTIRLNVRAETPQVIKHSSAGTVYSTFTIPDWPVCAEITGFQLPYKPILVHSGSPEPGIQIISMSDERIPNFIPPPYHDIADGLEYTLAEKPVRISGIIPAEPARLSFIGEYKGNTLWTVEVFPYQYDAGQKELIVHKNIVMDITGRSLDKDQIPPHELQLLENLGAVSLTKTKHVLIPALPKPYTSEGESWNIFIDKDGLVHLTGRDLARAGVKLVDMDVKSIRLTSKGRDVPVYVHGWRDGEMDSKDYIEFWGEYNRHTQQQKNPDIYQDPFSKVNVYRLSWGGPKGVWMVEQSQSYGNDFIRPFTFYQTVHVEKDKFYERLNLVPISL